MNHTLFAQLTNIMVLKGKSIPHGIFQTQCSPILYVTENKKYTLINKNLKRNFSVPKIKHPPDMALQRVKAVPSAAGRLIKGPQFSDNLFSVGLSVNHVDSISWGLTASGCARSSISLTSEASGRKRDGEIGRKRRREVNNSWSFYCISPLL